MSVLLPQPLSFKNCPQSSVFSGSLTGADQPSCFTHFRMLFSHPFLRLPVWLSLFLSELDGRTRLFVLILNPHQETFHSFPSAEEISTFTDSTWCPVSCKHAAPFLHPFFTVLSGVDILLRCRYCKGRPNFHLSPTRYLASIAL